MFKKFVDKDRTRGKKMKSWGIVKHVEKLNTWDDFFMISGIPFDEKKGLVPNVDGKVEDGLYCAGWLATGPRYVLK